MKIFSVTNPVLLRCKNVVKLGDLRDMGYVSEKGINFLSVEARKKCSKAICLKGPQCDPPHEVMTVSQGNRILYIGEGKFDSVGVPEKYYSMPDVEIEHSHPHDTPLSVPDYYTFLMHKYKSLVAYTPDGRYSKISRLPEKRYRFFNDYFQKRDVKNKMDLARKNFGYAQARFFKKTDWLYKILEKEGFDEEIVCKLEKKTQEYGQSMNVLWEMFAHSLGVKYENNLREKPKFSIFRRTLGEIFKRGLFIKIKKSNKLKKIKII